MSSTATIDNAVLTEDDPVPPVVARRPWWRSEAAAATFGAVLAMAAYCLAMYVRDTYPFGSRSRAVNDLANQFIPFHAYLWDLEHGKGTGDLLFNWSSGYGVPFFGDFVTYLANPFSWLVGLVPRDQVDLPVFGVTLFSIGLGTAMMTVFLGRLQPGSPWLRALLGVGYGLSAWVVNDGVYDPMWMWGIVGLPLILIAMDRSLHGRGWVVSSLLVAAAWGGNFYTAAMATIAAVLVLVVRLILAETPLRDRLVVLVKTGLMTVVGLLLTAPVLTVSMLASKHSQPPPAAIDRPVPDVFAVLAQLLPGGRANAAAPNIFVGIFALILVAAFPFHRLVAVKERVAWFALLVLVIASQLWKPTIIMWHGFALPNGSPYRASYVVTGLLVMIAWLSLARRPGPFALLAGGGTVAAIIVICRHQDAVRRSTWLIVLVGGAIVLGALLLARRWPGNRMIRAATAVALVATVFASTAYSAYVPDRLRADIPFFNPLPSMTSAQARQMYDDIQRVRSWPEQRVESGPHRFANNDPALLGAEGARYYSSYLPAVTAQTLWSLGVSWTMSGRHIHSPVDPVTRVVMGVGGYFDALQYTPTVDAPAPLVTVHPAGGATPDPASVFAYQQAVLGATVYEVPQLRHTAGPVPTRTATGWRLPVVGKAEPRTVWTARCAPGSEAYLSARWLNAFVGGLTYNGRFAGSFPLTSNPLQLLGTVPASGEIKLSMRAVRVAQDLPADMLGCLDHRALTAAVARLRATGATGVQAGGHTISATLPAGSTGTAVLAVTAVDGWSCSTDGHAAGKPTSFHGLIGVPLGGGASRVDCSFRPPGLLPGLAVSTVALVALLLGVLTNRLRRRRRR